MTKQNRSAKKRTYEWKKLVSVDLTRAISLDFEGFKGQTPSFAGVAIGGEFRQIVFDLDLAAAARHKGLDVLDIDEWGRKLVELAVREDRHVVGFSSAERTRLAELDIHVPESLYVNALKIAKAWRRKFHRSEHDRVIANHRRWRKSKSRKLKRRLRCNEGNRLMDFALLAGISPPHMYAQGKVTARLRAVLGQLQRRGEYRLLTRTAKSKWTNVLKHNRFDVVDFAEMIRVMIADFSRGGQR